MRPEEVLSGERRVRRPRDPDAPAARLRRRADRICSLIVASDYPEVDIDIEIASLHRWCARELPDRVELFDMIYRSRFARLREQFRGDRA